MARIGMRTDRLFRDRHVVSTKRINGKKKPPVVVLQSTDLDDGAWSRIYLSPADARVIAGLLLGAAVAIEREIV